MNVNGNSISIDIGASSDKAVEEINRVAAAMKNLRGATKETVMPKVDSSNLESASKSVDRYAVKIRDLRDLVRGMRSLWSDIGNFGKLSSEGFKIKDLQARLTSFDPFKYAAATISQPLIEGLALVENALASGSKVKLQPLRSEISSTAQALKTAEKAATGTANGIKQLSNEAKKSKSPLANFIASLKRIAYYRIIRGIIKSITQAFKEGLEKAYLFSTGIDGEGHRFADALDRMKSAGNAMKGQLGSAFISLLAAIEPVLTAIINLVIKVADAISQLLSAFTGKTYLKANATAAKFADTMARGAGAAKEWKNQLLGFDEINRLNEPSGGGGGGGSNPLDGYSFEEAPISEFWMGIKNKLAPIIEDIKLMLNGLLDFITGVFTGDWDLAFRGLGEIVSGFGSLCVHSIRATVDAFDGISGRIIEIVGKLLDWIQKETGLDLTDVKYIVLLTLNTIRFAVEGFAIQIGFIIQDLCEAVSYALNGDFDNAWKAAKKVVSDASVDIIGDAYEMAVEVTNNMMDGKDATNEFAETFTKNMESVRSSVDQTNSIHIDGGSILGSLVQWCQRAHDWIQDVLDGISALGGWQLDSISTALPGLDKLAARAAKAGVGKYASGGFPDAGELFVAREGGPELVGTMNGHTAVASNDQIVSGIQSGVFEAVLAAMSQSGSNRQGEVSVKVYLDGREIKASQERLARAWG